MRMFVPIRRPLLAMVVVALVVVGALAAVMWPRHGSDMRSGPLNPGSDGGWISTSIPVKDGVVTFSRQIPNTGTRPVVIDKVLLNGPPTGRRAQIRLVKAWISTAGAHLGGVAVGGYPSSSTFPHRRAAAGATLPPGSHQQLGLTLAPVPGHTEAVADGFDVSYHVGDQHYRDHWPEQIVLCAPAKVCDSKNWTRPPAPPGGS